MNIIMIAGNSRTGKTTVVARDFCDWLKGQPVKYIKPMNGFGNKEVEGVFQINGKNVAVFSRGDYFEEIVDAIVKYAHCDTLIITGSTSRVRIKRMVDAMRKNQNHCVIDKLARNDPDNKRVLNEIIANL